MICLDEGIFTNIGGEPMGWLKVVVDILVMTLITVGNLLIIIAVVSFWAKNKIPNSAKAGTVFVINLSISSVLVATSGTYFLSYGFLCSMSQGVGRTFVPCLFRYSLVLTGHYSAAFSIILITVDRYFAFVHTMAYDKSVTARRNIVLVILLWILSFCMSHMLFFWNNWSPDKPCHELIVIPTGYMIVFGSPLHTAILCTIGITHWKIHKVTSEIQQRQNNKKMTAMSSKPARASILVMIFYVVTWGPYMTAFLCSLCGVAVPAELMDFTVTFCSIAYLLIPFTYSWFNIAVKKSLLAMFPCLDRRRAAHKGNSLVSKLSSSTKGTVWTISEAERTHIHI